MFAAVGTYYLLALSFNEKDAMVYFFVKRFILSSIFSSDASQNIEPLNI